MAGLRIGKKFGTKLSGKASVLGLSLIHIFDKDTIDWDPNFDETKKEPSVLPCRFPNLLVNGSQGIAVGMATNIPPHNLSEVIDGCVAYIEDPDIDLPGLMEHIKGPDFPTAGIIMGRSGIRAAYATGRGKITLFLDHVRILQLLLPDRNLSCRLKATVAKDCSPHAHLVLLGCV